MKILRFLVIAVVTITMPWSQAFAVIPDAHLILSDVVEKGGEEQNISGSDTVENESSLTQDPVQTELIILSAPIDRAEQEDSGEEGAVVILDQESVDLLGGQPFWSRRKILVTTSILLAAGLLIGLLLLLAGSGGGSSGGGALSAGSFGGGGIAEAVNSVLGSATGGEAASFVSEANNLVGGGPNSDLADAVNDVVGGGASGGNDGPPILGGIGSNGGILDHPVAPFIPFSNIPHSPEPSTFLLLGMGLLIPFLRKRHL